MKKQQKPISPVIVWCYGLVLIVVWLAVSGQTMNQHLHKEQQGYSTALGKETGQWIVQHGSQLYRSTMIDTGFQRFLMKHTTPDSQMGEGFVRVVLFFNGVVKNLLILMLQMSERLALLIVCLPFWGLAEESINALPTFSWAIRLMRMNAGFIDILKAGSGTSHFRITSPPTKKPLSQ